MLAVSASPFVFALSTPFYHHQVPRIRLNMKAFLQHDFAFSSRASGARFSPPLHVFILLISIWSDPSFCHFNLVLPYWLLLPRMEIL